MKVSKFHMKVSMFHESFFVSFATITKIGTVVEGSADRAGGVGFNSLPSQIGNSVVTAACFFGGVLPRR